MTRLAFSKYEGLGNDFVLLEVERADLVSVDLARTLCDRRLGIGADGVLLILAPSSPGAHARMRVMNADGSTPEMCGNGLRCAALHLARSRGVQQGQLVLDTDAGIRPCVVDDRDGKGLVTADMGIVTVSNEISLDLDGDVWAFVLADAGNPHAVTWRPATRAVIDGVGPRVSEHRCFASGSNVEFARYSSGVVDLVVYERGVGVTLACGTGACAAVAVGVKMGHLLPGRDVIVNLPGGSLFVAVAEDGFTTLRGPARHVFSGGFHL